ncbi:MAG TPA: two-component regulator propeller domain-containing protein, partial [Bacteroidia bacterium]
MRVIKLVIFCCLLSLVKPAFAQLYNFKVFNNKHGLANSTVNAIHQSSEGYIWFATQGGGLSRFDGKSFRNFTKDDGLISNDILSIYEDDQHNIWVGTIEGLSKFNGKSFKNYSEKDGVGSYEIYNINKSSDGNIWISTFGGGIKIIKGDKVTQTLDTSNALPTNNVFCTLEDKDGSVWVGLYSEGLVKISKEGKLLHRFKDLRPDLRNCSAFSLAQSPDGTVWVGSAGNGLFKVKNNKIEYVNYPAIEKDIVGKVIVDKFENVWAAADNGLLRISKNNEFKLFGEKEGLSSIRCQTLCEDYEGNIWIGTLGGGVCMYRNEAIVSFTQKDGLSNNKIYAVLSSKKYLLAGSLSGLDYFDGEQFRKVNEKSIVKSAIACLFEDSKGNIWVATEAEGVVVFSFNGVSFNKIKHYTIVDGKVVQPAYKITEDKDGVIWISTYGHGLFKIKNDVASSVIDKNLTGSDILPIYCNVNNKLYAAVNQQGVFIKE